MLEPAEIKHISRASTMGTHCIKFDHDHLKLLHLMVPFRNIVSYMTRHNAKTFPVCFLINPVPGHRECCMKQHGPFELNKVMERRESGTRDRHVWLSVEELTRAFKLQELCDKLAPDKDHDTTKKKLNNFHPILDEDAHFYLCGCRCGWP